jgi:hypothetical protein
LGGPSSRVWWLEAALALRAGFRHGENVTPETAYVTREDLYAVRDELRTVQDELRAEFRSEIRHLSDRIDRVQLTLVAGFMSMVVALIVVGFFG